MDTVRLTCGGLANRFSWATPGNAPQIFTLVNARSAAIPKDGIYATYNAFLSGSSGAVAATMTFFATNDPHTAGADDPQLGFRNNFNIGITNTSTNITSAEGLFRTDMDQNEVYCAGVPYGTLMTYVSPTQATLAAPATTTNPNARARFQSTNWVQLAAVSLAGTRFASDGFATASAWKWVCCVVSGISGTNAAALAIQGN